MILPVGSTCQLIRQGKVPLAAIVTFVDNPPTMVRVSCWDESGVASMRTNLHVLQPGEQVPTYDHIQPMPPPPGTPDIQPMSGGTK